MGRMAVAPTSVRTLEFFKGHLPARGGVISSSPQATPDRRPGPGITNSRRTLFAAGCPQGIRTTIGAALFFV